MIEYDLIINDTKAYYKLVGLCVLLFISLVVVWFTLLAFDLLILTETAIIIEVFIVLGSPFVLFFLLRHRTAIPASAVLAGDYFEFTVKGKTEKILFSEMKSYSADEMRDEDKVVSLRIRTKSGKKFRLYATSDICNTQSMTELCRDFERAAKDQNVESKFLSW